ncbi:MAG TPA: metallophosphoesterase [Isosphaeraceae bacterium]|nr:metallophosphoesterase [Isosphaeraceae bacterium]
MATTDGTVRIAAIGDIHCGKTSQGAFQSLFARVAEFADVFVLCGDLTDYGLPEEARILAKELAAVAKVPIIGVLGNHDFESGHPDEVRQILGDAGVTMLDGESCEIRGIGFAGAKGFAGGFGRGTLGAWGEAVVKQFVQEAIDEALKLESALARLKTPHRVAVLHYAPVRETVEGEPIEIFPYLGCSRLEEPLARYPVDAVVHGHAHNGAPEGRARGDIPVYNVSMSLLQKTFPDRPPFRLLEIPIAP